MDPQPTPNRCPACFAELVGASCTECGWHPGDDNQAPCLPQGIVLDGRYRIGRVLGHGGFGITYLGWDVHLKTRRAIKEYLPTDLATRASGETRIAVFTGEREHQFSDGLKRFLNEAEHLARFEQHPGIVNVVSYFSAHDTGYMVMEYLDGITLREYLEQQGGRIGLATASNILMPIMDALHAVHKAELLHRDIAPDNIHISRHGQVKLLDFGAARQSTQGQSRSLSVILKPGYAPEEQYRSRARQDPATDVYALSATLYRAITGETPPEALERRPEDPLQPPSRLGVRITPAQEAVILKGLALEAPQRYQGIAELQQALQAASLGMQPPPHGEDIEPLPPTPADPLPRPPRRNWLPWALVGVLGMALIVALIRLFGDPSLTTDDSEGAAQQTARQTELELQQEETQRQAERDRQAWRAAQGQDDIGAYQAYLAHCAVDGCGYRTEAEQRLAALQEAARLADIERQRELEKQRQQQEAERKAQRDLPAWRSAEQRNDSAGYQAYLRDCAANGCGYRSQAEAALAKLAELDKARDPVTGMEFVRVPGGCYQMGSNGGDSDEKPVHEVCVDDFWLGKYEVTQGQWTQIMGDNPSEFKNGDDYPVEQVSWDKVQAFIGKLNAEGSGQYRLPTEAEWEYACRGGGKDETWAGTSTKSLLDGYANICDAGSCEYDWKESGLDDGYPNTSPVGHFTANEPGMYDMTGNVWEWVQDIYASDAYGTHSRNNPINTGGASPRVYRGGGWSNDAAGARCAYRYGDALGFRNLSLGVRLLRN